MMTHKYEVTIYGKAKTRVRTADTAKDAIAYMNSFQYDDTVTLIEVVDTDNNEIVGRLTNED